MKLNKINIYEASDHAKVVIDCIQSSDDFHVGYVFDDNVNGSNVCKLYTVICKICKRFSGSVSRKSSCLFLADVR